MDWNIFKIADWVESVQGKKIWHTTMIKGTYFIPNKLLNIFWTGNVMQGINENGINQLAFVYKGFEIDENGHCWKLIEGFDEIPNIIIPSNKNCCCSSSDLFNFGCKCGAFKRKTI